MSDVDKNLERAMDKYKKTGNLSAIENEVQYLYDKGFTKKELGGFLNVPETKLPKNNKKVDYKTENEAKEISDTNMKPDNIMGMPFYFNPLADPNRRVFNNTLLGDLPIITMIPGEPQFAKNSEDVGGFFEKMIDKVTDTETVSEDEDSGSVTERGFLNIFKMDSDEEIESWLYKNAKNSSVNKDLRYYGFRPAYSKYAKHLQLLASTVGIKMNAIGGLYKLSDSFERDFAQKGIKFYCTKSTTINESLDNSFGPSNINDSVNGISSMAREFQFLTGTQKGKKTEDVGELDEGLKKDMEEMGNRTSIFGKLGGALGDMVGTYKNAALSGSNIHFPEVWQDSSFSRSYQLDFRFTSPYGHPKAIFEYIYLPFLMLLTMAMPKSDSLMGYYSPYILRVSKTALIKSF